MDIGMPQTVTISESIPPKTRVTLKMPDDPRGRPEPVHPGAPRTDDGYFWGFEDVDFCQRLHRAGLRVVYYPYTSVVHAIGVSARTVPNRAIIARHRGMWRYYKRWLAANPVLDASVFAGVWLRCGLQVAVSTTKRGLAGARGR